MPFVFDSGNTNDEWFLKKSREYFSPSYFLPCRRVLVFICQLIDTIIQVVTTENWTVVVWKPLMPLWSEAAQHDKNYLIWQKPSLRNTSDWVLKVRLLLQPTTRAGLRFGVTFGGGSHVIHLFYMDCDRRQQFSKVPNWSLGLSL